MSEIWPLFNYYYYYYAENNNSEDETTQKQDPIPLAGEWDNNQVTEAVTCVGHGVHGRPGLPALAAVHAEEV